MLGPVGTWLAIVVPTGLGVAALTFIIGREVVRGRRERGGPR